MCNHQTAYEQCRSYSILEINDLQEMLQPRGNAKIMRGYHPTLGKAPIGIKRIPVKAARGIAEAALIREMAIWCTLKDANSNVLELLGMVTFGGEQPRAGGGQLSYFSQSPVFYYYENGDLIEYLGRNQPSNLSQLTLFKDIAAGTNYMHDQNIVHGDLKPANVLIDHRERAKICDFGSSVVLEGCPECLAGPPEDTQSLATHIYLSPEIWDEEEQISYQSDIWALGCLLFEMQTGERVYNGKGKTDNQIMFNMIGKKLPPATVQGFGQNEFSKAVGKVAIKCWSEDPQCRPSAGRVLQELNEIKP